jgi:hypothetical protein
VGDSVNVAASSSAAFGFGVSHIGKYRYMRDVNPDECRDLAATLAGLDHSTLPVYDCRRVASLLEEYAISPSGSTARANALRGVFEAAREYVRGTDPEPTRAGRVFEALRTIDAV